MRKPSTAPTPGPKHPRQQAPDPIRYTIGDSSLGPVLAAATRNGLCAILLDESPEALEDDLRQHFGKHQLLRDATGMTGLLKEVVQLVDAPHGAPTFALDPQGTPFQLQVWSALRAVPPGETTTYTGLATMLGLPATSVRAIGGAVGANALAVAIPCHRVVGSEGKLSGFRWGLDRKRALLEREAAATAFALRP